MDSMHEDLQPTDSDLMGQWLDTGSRMEGDAVWARIEWLTAERLERLAVDPTGGDTLFRDPRDGRLWELTHPFGEMHGGGPPRLAVLTPAEAARKYGTS